MKKLLLLLLIFAAPALLVTAQTKPDTANIRDSISSHYEIREVVIKSYLFYQPLLNTPSAISTIGPNQLKQQSGASFVPALNTIPGVRMEERSPGSYRLSLRGSLLRSPFGVRDVKVYFDELPLTDAGGNTYLNAVDVNSIYSLEILRGPDGSLFGANSGGVVTIRPVGSPQQTSGSVSLKGGSYGLFQQNAGINVVSGKNQLSINQGYQTYDGYRVHSNMRRNYVQAVDKFRYGTDNELKVLGFYSDLFYNTPGGLTFAQMQANPRAARPATPVVPGALEQNISITTQMAMGGVVNSWNINNHLKNVTAIFGSHVYFANPFITNYEQRTENTFGARSYFEWNNNNGAFNWKINAGVEWQQTNSGINNYGNRAGVKDTVQKLDKINSNQHFFFARYVADIDALHIEAAVSLNNYRFNFRNVAPLNQPGYTPRDFDAQWMPRLALSYKLTNIVAVRASVSKGYSNPTTAEVRPTDNIINTALQAQTGWNYEGGIRLQDEVHRLNFDAGVFHYRTNNAIVRRLNPNETEFYVNAGGTNQTGVEAALNWDLMRARQQGLLRSLQLNSAFTYSRYFFRDYSVGTTSFSGNRLTGVPRQVVVSSLQIGLPASLTAFIQHNYTSSLPLNDVNSIYADKYHLLQARLGWAHNLSPKVKLEIFAGGDNLLNQKYSLGNDLNAVGNRYFNPSPLRNYYGGVVASF